MANRIRAWREAHNITQTQLAQILTDAGYPAGQALVSHWESGRVRITPDRAKQLDEISHGELPRALLVFGDSEAA